MSAGNNGNNKIGSRHINWRGYSDFTSIDSCFRRDCQLQFPIIISEPRPQMWFVIEKISRQAVRALKSPSNIVKSPLHFSPKNGVFRVFSSDENGFFKESEKKFSKNYLLKSANYEKSEIFFQKRFGGNENVFTFALPIGNERAAEKETKGTKKVL
jgi:hypothetical protein